MLEENYQKKHRVTPFNQFTDSLLPVTDPGFEDTRLLKELTPWPQEFVKVSPVRTFEGPFLSMVDHAGPIRIGDILLIQPRKSVDSSGRKIPPLVMFYAGEASFPGLGNKTLDQIAGQDVDAGNRKLARLSFFVYPYLAGLEWNTFPPRQHKTLRKYMFDKMSFWDKLVAWTKRVFTKFSFSWNPDGSFSFKDDTVRKVRWLNTKIADNYCGVFHKDSYWCSTIDKSTVRIKYQVVRIKDQCEYTTLKHHFPVYKQFDSDNTCFFAAYSQAAMYQMYAHVRRLGHDEVHTYEKRLIAGEVTSPTSKSAKISSDFFRGMLILNQKEWVGTDSKPWKDRWDDSRLNKSLAMGKHLAYWMRSCFWDRQDNLGLIPTATVDGQQGTDVSALLSKDEMFALLKNTIKSDIPMITYFSFNIEGGAVEVDTKWRGIAETKLFDDQSDALIGHVVPVVGVRECGSQRFIHVAWSDGEFTYITLENFYHVVVVQQGDPKRQLVGIQIPAEWKSKWEKGKKIPSGGIGYVIPRFMAIEKGKEKFRP